MPRGMLIVRPNGAEVLRMAGELTSSETEAGWCVEFQADTGMADLAPEQVVGEAADVAIDDTHYAGQVTEFHTAEHRIVVEGEGRRPAYH